jgi:hypothetical protein
MSTSVNDHRGLHSEEGARKGEHPGRAPNPIIKVRDLAWLEFEKPDLQGSETFAHAFGFATAASTPDEIHLRGTDPGAPCILIRRAERSRFVGVAFKADDTSDVRRLAVATGRETRLLPESLGGIAVDLTDPSGLPVRVVSDTHELHPLLPQVASVLNFGCDVKRVNAPQRPPRVPARIQRLGHVVIQTTNYIKSLNWYLEHLGMIVSDFQYYPGQRRRGPRMSFIRCDRGTTPTDHHTLALALGPANRYVHSAYQVADLDAVAAGGEYLLERGYERAWGIGRHILGSQIFDYWNDPDGFMVEHFTDGDLFDSTLESGWEAFTASGLSQWGPPISKAFTGLNARALPKEMRHIVSALRADNEFDLKALLGLMRMATS